MATGDPPRREFYFLDDMPYRNHINPYGDVNIAYKEYDNGPLATAIQGLLQAGFGTPQSKIIEEMTYRMRYSQSEVFDMLYEVCNQALANTVAEARSRGHCISCGMDIRKDEEMRTRLASFQTTFAKAKEISGITSAEDMVDLVEQMKEELDLLEEELTEIGDSMT